MGREPHLQRTDRTLVSRAVEYEHSAGSAPGDEAREHVDELVAVGERPCVKQVVAVEEVEGRLSHLEPRVDAVLRRAVPPRQPRR